MCVVKTLGSCPLLQKIRSGNALAQAGMGLAKIVKTPCLDQASSKRTDLCVQHYQRINYRLNAASTSCFRASSIHPLDRKLHSSYRQSPHIHKHQKPSLPEAW